MLRLNFGAWITISAAGVPTDAPLRASDELQKHGFRLVENTKRFIEHKNTPYVIDRKARCRDAAKVRTMEREFILAYEKVATRGKKTAAGPS